MAAVGVVVRVDTVVRVVVVVVAVLLVLVVAVLVLVTAAEPAWFEAVVLAFGTRGRFSAVV